MECYKKLIARLTDRLGVDRELQMEVGEELRGHLEDSAAEFAEGGLSEEEAGEQACKAMGNADELADALWKANRGRLKWRGVIRWVARVALVPCALLVVWMILAGVSGNISVIDLGRGNFLDLDGYGKTDWGSLDGLSEEERFIFRGDPLAETELEAEKSIVDRWPSEAIYYGNYVTRLMVDKDGGSSSWEKGELEEYLDVLNRGEEIDPDNAVYNYIKAAWLLEGAVTVGDDPLREYTYRYESDGKENKVIFGEIEIHDMAAFERGLAEFRRGIEKAEVSPRCFEMASLRLGMLPEPGRLMDYVNRVSFQLRILLPHLGRYRELANTITAYTIDIAEAGEGEKAIELAGMVEEMGAQIGAEAKCIVELLVGWGVCNQGMVCREIVYRELGEMEKAEEARVEFEKIVAEFDKSRVKRNENRLDKEEKRHSSLMMGWLYGSIYDGKPNFEPTRTAEQAVMGQMALLGLLSVLAGLMVFFGGLSASNLLLGRGRIEKRGVLVFVGWERIGKICLLGIGVPMLVYILWVYLLTNNSMYGLKYIGGKVILEYAVTGFVMVLLLMWMSYGAIRARCLELGLAVPGVIGWRGRKWILGMGVMVMLVAVIFLIAWWTGLIELSSRKGDNDTLIWGLFVSEIIAAYCFVWFIREMVGLFFWGKAVGRFRWTFFRSLVPILAASVILVGGLCGGALVRIEGAAVSRIKGSADISFGGNEADRSVFSGLKEWFVARREVRGE